MSRLVPKGQPIIIVKKRGRGHHEAHHSSAWKVAYADFVTAMMAFFMVMWLINTSPQVRSSLASYFRDPGVFELTSGGGAMSGASAGATAGNAQAPPVAMARAVLEHTADEIKEALERLPSFHEMKDRIEIDVSAEGLRIELSDLGQESFFDVGSTTVGPQMVEVLRTITQNVRHLPNKIAIEGHTDSRPYGPGGNYSNWELSSGRANAARRVMEEAGLDETHLEALHGYGSARLRYPERPLDARNRRIAIVIRHLAT